MSLPKDISHHFDFPLLPLSGSLPCPKGGVADSHRAPFPFPDKRSSFPFSTPPKETKPAPQPRADPLPLPPQSR